MDDAAADQRQPAVHGAQDAAPREITIVLPEPKIVGKSFVLDDVVIYRRPTVPMHMVEVHWDGSVTESIVLPEPPTQAQQQLNQKLYPSDYP